MHNLTIGNLHTYYVQPGTTPVLVHNACGDFTTSPNTAYFWSGLGRGGEDIAADWVRDNAPAGSTTLEMLMKDRGIILPPWDGTPAVTAIWEDASAAYAAGAKGVVKAVIGPNMRAGSIWRTVELDALKNNPAVTKIIEIDVTTGKETVVFTR
jgi:hypothetical protein